MKDFLKKYNLYYEKEFVARIVFLGTAFWGIISLIMVALNKFLLPFTTLKEQNFLLHLNLSSTEFLDNFAKILSQTFQPEIITILLIIIGLILVFARKQGKIGLFIIMTSGGAAVFGQIYKIVFARARPNLWNGVMTEESYSFPSGHALMTTVLIGVIAIILFRYLNKEYLKYALFAALSCAVLAVCWARLYLGVHYPTDVIVGVDIGIFWIWAASTLFLPKTRDPETKII